MVVDMELVETKVHHLQYLMVEQVDLEVDQVVIEVMLLMHLLEINL